MGHLCWGKNASKVVLSSLCYAQLQFFSPGQPFSLLAFTAAGTIKSIDSFPRHMKEKRTAFIKPPGTY